MWFCVSLCSLKKKKNDIHEQLNAQDITIITIKESLSVCRCALNALSFTRNLKPPRLTASSLRSTIHLAQVI